MNHLELILNNNLPIVYEEISYKSEIFFLTKFIKNANESC